MPQPKLLFVYGSLRTESPHPFAVKLRNQGRLLGKGTAPGILYDLGRYPAACLGASIKAASSAKFSSSPRRPSVARARLF